MLLHFNASDAHKALANCLRIALIPSLLLLATSRFVRCLDSSIDFVDVFNDARYYTPLDNVVFGKLLVEEEEDELPSAFLLIKSAIEHYKAAIKAAQTLIEDNDDPISHDRHKKCHTKSRATSRPALFVAAHRDYREKLLASEAYLPKLRLQEKALDRLCLSLMRVGEDREADRSRLLRLYTMNVADEIWTASHEMFPKVKSENWMEESDKAACIEDLLTSERYLDMLQTNAYDVAVLNHKPTYDSISS